MATPVFCCGAECGVAGAHWTLSGTTSFDTGTFRTGLRSIRSNPTAGGDGWAYHTWAAGAQTRVIGRVYVRFATLPDADTPLVWLAAAAGSPAGGPQVRFKLSDSKIYASIGTTLGATGVTVTTGVWYRIDFDFNIQTGGNDVCDVQVDGTACGQATASGLAASQVTIGFGCENTTADIFFDDLIFSLTAADYPLGQGFVKSYIPNADGAHNVAGANDFERSTGGVDITNATTDAYQLVDDRPLKSGAPDTEFINMIAPPNATDYVELAFENSAESVAPRTIEVIAKVAQAGTGLGNMELRLNDNGSMGTIYTATGVAGIVNGKYVRAHFADPPSAATAWNIAGDGGNGDFQDIRVRFGSPAALDVNPDQYLVSIMIEAEYVEAVFDAALQAAVQMGDINLAPRGVEVVSA